MRKTPTTLPFKGTAEQEKRLRDGIAEAKTHGEGTMSVLQRAQEIYGYLPIEVQEIVAEGMGASLSEVYGIATFYAQFLLSPRAQTQISVCLGTACYVKGCKLVIEEIEKELGIKCGQETADGKFSFEATRCLGACGLAPVMMINNEVYGKLVPKDIKGILNKYR
ncbi:MAG TPA: NAD(P)H-dependent oxidoreductase subunit E [Oscillospiraceae bacterium]|nr:NAD(P)H-dependent oxidoreductase subunit E [Oscillospiraceae bacterium]HPS34681.1 NAD(P)H-dependent oxidoreductase subunit E [Oscillospiraceae bacterium]